jgi:hypothetical protein
MSAALLIAGFVLLVTLGLVRRYLPRDRPQRDTSDASVQPIALAELDADVA